MAEGDSKYIIMIKEIGVAVLSIFMANSAVKA